jgi:hypothetical protein
MALTIATTAYKKHKENPDIGIKYAIALINNGQYATGLKTMEGMHILPSEGARQGKILFEQACLFLAMDQIKSKKYNDAIKMIEKSKEWPENLGVGKPYDVDVRIQDYLNIFCLQKMNRTGDADPLRKSIIDYTNQNMGSPSFSNVLAIKLLKEKGETAAANDMIKKFEASKNPVQKWVVATVNNDQTTANNLEKDFVKNPNYMIIKKLIEVTGK